MDPARDAEAPGSAGWIGHGTDVPRDPGGLEAGQPAEDVPPTAGIVVAADDPEFNQTFLRVLLGEGGHAVFWRGSGWLRTGADGESRRWRLQDRRDC